MNEDSFLYVPDDNWDLTKRLAKAFTGMLRDFAVNFDHGAIHPMSNGDALRFVATTLDDLVPQIDAERGEQKTRWGNL